MGGWLFMSMRKLVMDDSKSSRYSLRAVRLSRLRIGLLSVWPIVRYAALCYDCAVLMRV